MCGFAGRFHPTLLPPADGWCTKVSGLLAHRGPDGAGHYRDPRCELVHRRLALIDLSPTGHQPMANEIGTIQVVFNGEIYNHHELRAHLERRGHVFRGTSDTEVLVHLYEDLGERLVERLRGIFAFALYDGPRHRLVLARDRFGVKPLFYARTGGQWVFASEIKAVTALPAFHPGLDRQACFDFLGFGYVPEPATGFAEIAALPHGTTLIVDPEGYRARTYYQAEARPALDRSVSDAADVAAERLMNAVRRQMAADVPVAALLSGGIDSSLVVAARQRAAVAPTTTFNVRFPDRRHDETPMARAVAAHCGTDHHTISAGERHLSAEAILGLFRHFDQPFADTSLIPTYWVAAGIRDRGIICALSGDGGDEAFGGYARFWRANRLAQLMRAPAWLRHVARWSGTALTGWTRDWGRQVTKAVVLADAGRQDAAVLLAGLSNYLNEDQKAELVLREARDQLLPSVRHFDGYRLAGVTDSEELSRRITETLFRVSLPSDMLRKVDMMSMRASIEVRVPLLDEDMVELGLTLRHGLKTDGRSGKIVLRELARRWLPAKVAEHPKHGFTVPLDVMLPEDFHGVLADLLCGSDARTHPVLNQRLVARWLRTFAEARRGLPGGAISRAGLYQRVFTVAALELWLRDHSLSW
jgi:asparagine synthase (glutamine-hydrolysing)